MAISMTIVWWKNRPLDCGNVANISSCWSKCNHVTYIETLSPKLDRDKVSFGLRYHILRIKTKLRKLVGIFVQGADEEISLCVWNTNATLSCVVLFPIAALHSRAEGIFQSYHSCFDKLLGENFIVSFVTQVFHDALPDVDGSVKDCRSKVLVCLHNDVVVFGDEGAVVAASVRS